jgi:histone H3/H4
VVAGPAGRLSKEEEAQVARAFKLLSRIVQAVFAASGDRVLQARAIVWEDVIGGAAALEEIRQCQGSVEPLLPFIEFALLVQEIMREFMTDLSFTADAIEALREAAEAQIVRRFGGACGIASARNSGTLMPADLKQAVLMGDPRWAK